MEEEDDLGDTQAAREDQMEPALLRRVKLLMLRPSRMGLLVKVTPGVMCVKGISLIMPEIISNRFVLAVLNSKP